ncbi:MAG: hypothetical protein WKF30_18070 [Pyrinomonadaceae bacterium]
MATTGEAELLAGVLGDVSVGDGGAAGRKPPVLVARSPPDSGPLPLERDSFLI